MNKKSLPQWLSAIPRHLVPNVGSIVVMALMLFVYHVSAAAPA